MVGIFVFQQDIERKNIINITKNIKHMVQNEEFVIYILLKWGRLKNLHKENMC